MTNYKDTLIQLTQNLNLLRECEAKCPGNVPLDLLNQIEDYEQAITLTQQANAGELSEAVWREKLRPLLAKIEERSATEAISTLTLGGVDFSNFSYSTDYLADFRADWRTGFRAGWRAPRAYWRTGFRADERAALANWRANWWAICWADSRDG